MDIQYFNEEVLKDLHAKHCEDGKNEISCPLCEAGNVPVVKGIFMQAETKTHPGRVYSRSGFANPKPEGSPDTSGPYMNTSSDPSYDPNDHLNRKDRRAAEAKKRQKQKKVKFKKNEGFKNKENWQNQKTNQPKSYQNTATPVKSHKIKTSSES